MVSGNLISFDAKKIFMNNTSLVSTRIHKIFLYVIFLYFNISPLSHLYPPSYILKVIWLLCILFQRLSYTYISFTKFALHKSTIWQNSIMHISILHHEYLWVYISTNNGSVVQTIPEMCRKKSIRIELLILKCSCRYKSKPKRNSFLGHPGLLCA